MALRRANAMDIDLPSEGESVVSLPSQDDSGSDAEVETSWICSCKTACVKPGSDLLNFCKVTRESLQKLDRELHRKGFGSCCVSCVSTRRWSAGTS